MFYFRLFKTYFIVRVKRLITFKGSFIIQFFAQGSNYAATFLLMYVMITAFGNLNNWTSYEVMLLYALSLLSYGFAGMFFYFFRLNTTNEIFNGSFDDALVKPIHTLPYLVFKAMTPAYIIHISLAIVVLVFCVVKLKLVITLFMLVWLFVIILCGILIFGGMFIFITAPAFIMTQTDSLGSILFFLRESGYYPISIFPKFIQIIMTFILPYSMMNFFPIQLILNKHDYVGFGVIMPWLAPLCALMFFSLSVVCFALLARRYKSTGS